MTLQSLQFCKQFHGCYNKIVPDSGFSIQLVFTGRNWTHLEEIKNLCLITVSVYAKLDTREQAAVF